MHRRVVPAAIDLHCAATPYTWDPKRRLILMGSLDVAPSFKEDQLQPSVGWPLVEMALQGGNGPVILREQRTLCRMLKFAEELGISTRFEPFTLLERSGSLNRHRFGLWQKTSAGNSASAITAGPWPSWKHLWNSLRDLLSSQGNATLLGSRDTLREAFRLGLFEEGEAWMLMIQDRNLTSHTYNRSTADAIATQIVGSYLPCFQHLRARLEQRLSQEALEG